MATTALTLESQVTTLQADIKVTLETFYASLPEMNSLNAMSAALVEQSKQITVFQRDRTGKIVVNDADAYVRATEQVQALKAVEEQIAELMDPFIEKLYKAHRTSTAIRKQYLDAGQAEQKRLKQEREQFAAEDERKRREVALRAQQEAQEAERQRLLAEAQVRKAEGDVREANELIAEAEHVEAPPVAIPSTTPQIAGTSYRSKWEWTLTDLSKLKPEFVIPATPNEKAINSMVTSMHKAAEAVVGAGAINVFERKIVVDR